MGIYDREYYREGSGFSHWFASIAPACRTIILINIAVYVLELLIGTPRSGGSNWLINWCSANSPDILERFQVWRLITAPFLHSPENIFHIVFNMLAFYFIGRELESLLGTKEFTFFYLTAAVFSTALWAVVDYVIPGRRNPATNMLGASGAISGMLVLFSLYYPNREVLLFFVLPMKIWVLVIIVLALDSMRLFQQFQGDSLGEGSQVAFASHLSGALFGWMYRQFQWKLSDLWRPRSIRPRLRVVYPPSSGSSGGSGTRKTSQLRPDQGRSARPVANTSVPEDTLDTRLDQVLAKILREGKESLTGDEKQVLEEASRRARSRRSEKS